jgi:hypothetical protein
LRDEAADLGFFVGCGVERFGPRNHARVPLLT